jgi:hypothetical protein
LAVDDCFVVLPDDVTLDRGAPSINFEARDVRRVAKEGRKDLFVSSSLSDGPREPMGILFKGDPPRTGSDMADGRSDGLFFSRAACEEGFAVFDLSLVRLAMSRLLPLRIGSGLLESSALLPVPRMATGASLSRK